ncbi:hypothetical protein CC78DRAFT_547463 [Lojkania enalia]|uniref:AttH domain-containing protein n=1 Tax=Lojkania enalia TaxID=147567 RepID=A0A9P4K1R9_9PLEO|nr:hypothetical protein CC78DRAFT_547463 [Didymosphaeria enalia]
MCATMKLLTLLGTFALVSAFGSPLNTEPRRDYGYINELFQKPIDAEWEAALTYPNVALDKPRLIPRPNVTSFDMWYFDGVNRANINESVTVTFYLATNASIPFRSDSTTSISLDLALTFADGTQNFFQINSAIGGYGWAMIHTMGPGSNSTFTLGAKWASNWDGTEYVVNVEGAEREHRFEGELKLSSAAPARYPCHLASDLTGRNISLEVMPKLGWTNILPDARASAKFTLTNLDLDTQESSEQTIAFENGIGFHDQLWSDRPFPLIAQYWSRGHVRLSPFGNDTGAMWSLVWFHGIDRRGKVHNSAYISASGTSILLDCEKDVVKEKVELLEFQEMDKCVRIKVKLQEEDYLEIDIPKENFVQELTANHYERWSGMAQGTLGEEVELKGAAMFEIMNMSKL